MPNTSNISPSFARDASQQLHDGSVQSAVELCIAGTRKFPGYATGFLVLGKCYDALGRITEALAAYRQAFAILPENPSLHALVRQAEAKLARESPQRGDDERNNAGVKPLSDESGPRPENEQRAEDERQQTPEMKTTEPVPVQPEPPTIVREQATTESPFDYLTRRLQNVKRIKPNPSATPQTARVEAGRSMNFVTPTMAEIFVGQGEYKEAINAYNELIRQSPLEEKYKKRLAEVEQLLIMQAKENS